MPAGPSNPCRHATAVCARRDHRCIESVTFAHADSAYKETLMAAGYTMTIDGKSVKGSKSTGV
ncbi:hypothetical protein, partial [Candidatus Binatus sp.]|uniref:hypothetical protein n=1 Tax=Candidatus Binatus sp. TaxID=2811406 RepID=UPI003C71D1D1